LAISYAFTYTASVLFCALNPGDCFAAVRLMPVPSPADDQFVEPSKATMPSRTPPLGVADLACGRLADHEVVGEALSVLRPVRAQNRLLVRNTGL